MQAAEPLATDPNVEAADFPYDSEGVRAFAASICDDRYLDGLTDKDAHEVAISTMLSFVANGVAGMARRFAHLLNGENLPSRGLDDPIKVFHTLAHILQTTLSAFMVEE